MNTPNGGLEMGLRGCPDMEHGKPAAVVNIEWPILVTVGFLLMAAGFTLQYFSIPDPQTVEEMRRDLKELKRKHSYGRR